MLKKFFSFIKKGRQLHIWFLSYLIIVLVGVVLSFFLYFSSANIVRNQTEKNMHFTVDQMRLFYDEDFLSIQNSAYTILEDASISALAKNPFPEESSERRTQYNDISKRISSQINDSISSFFIMLADSDLALDSGGSSTKLPIYQRYFADCYPTPEEWLSDFSLKDKYADCKFLKDKNGKSKICYVQRMPLSTSSPLKATAVITLNTEEIVDNRLSFAEYINPVMTLLNHNNEVIYTTATEEESAIISDVKNDSYIRVSVPSQFMNWKYELAIPTQSLYKDLRNMQIIAILTYLVYLIAGIFLSYYLSKRSYRPLSLLLTKFKGEALHSSQNEFSFLDDRISQMFEKEHLTEKELSSKTNKLIENHLSNLLFGKADLKKEYHVEFKKGSLYLVLFKVINTGIFNDESQNNTETIHFLIKNIFSEITETLGTTYFFPCEDYYACIINSKKELSELEICSQTEFTIEFLQENFAAGIICAVSDGVLSESGLPALYSQAKDIIAIGRNSENASVLLPDSLSEISYIFPQETEHMLTKSLMRGDYESSEKIISDIFSKTFDKKELIPSLKQIFFCDLIGTVLKVSAAINENKQFYSMFNEVFHQESIEESKRVLLSYIEILCNKIAESCETVDDRINQIMTFVEENYSDPNLNVSYIANKFDITINYLSSYFKTKTGKVLSDYILRYRLEKACQLLSKKVSVTETCHACGFCDVNAFIRAFKKTYGVTPGKYIKN